MFTDPTLTLADQLIGIVALFCKTVAAEACKPRFGSLSVALWNRVRRLERRFCALYAQWKAGTLAKVRVPLRSSASSAVKGLDRGERREARSEGVAGGDAVRMRPASLLPRALRWMQGMLPQSAGTLASMFGALVENHPEMQAFVAECPQVGRVLRPLCRMAGLKPPEWLALPKRKKDTSPRLVRSAAQSPHSGEGEGSGVSEAIFPTPRLRRTAREVAVAAMEKARRTGKPIDWKKLGAVAAGYVLHWPRDALCPPPEVGYAPMRVRVPRDYRPPRDDE